jgi:predicted metal-dependent TIM-barrel fold hydrolase
MRIFDPHVHMTSRTTDDYEAMAAAGVRALVEPAFWLGQPRTSVGSFVDYFDSLLGWERFRASQFGIAHHCTVGLNPKEAADPRLAHEVLEVLPRYLAKDRVVAIGEIGFDGGTAAEERAFVAQLELAAAHDLPVLVHTPHRDKVVGTVRSLELVAASPVAPARTLIDHNTELTFERVLASGCWCGFTIYPDTKMDERRFVRIAEAHGLERMLVNSAADWGRSDPLKVPRTAAALLAAGFSEREVERLVWDNPVAFFAQSGRLEVGEGAALGAEGAEGAAGGLGEAPGPAGPPALDPHATYAGNSILRGARPG